MLPLGLISICSISSLVCSRENVGDRLAITLTMVLTSISFKYTTSASLPKVSYQTLLDTYILLSFVLLVVVVVADIAFFVPDLFVDRAYLEDTEYMALLHDTRFPWLERALMNLFALVLVVGHAILLLWLLWKYEVNRAWCKETGPVDPAFAQDDRHLPDTTHRRCNAGRTLRNQKPRPIQRGRLGLRRASSPPRPAVYGSVVGLA